MFEFSYYFGKSESYYIENYGFNYTAFSFGEIPKISLLASNFMHGNPAHLSGNVILLFLFGIFLEKEIGHIKLISSYLIAGLGGTFLQGMFIPTRAFGASASIYGLIGVFIVVFILDYKRYIREDKLFFCYTPILFALALTLLVLFFHRVFTNPNLKIGDIAHYWGFAIGVILGIFIRSREINDWVNKKKFKFT